MASEAGRLFLLKAPLDIIQSFVGSSHVMRYLRPHGPAAFALALTLFPGAVPSLAQAPLVTRSLESSPADIIFRHSGRQAAEPWGEFYGEELVTGDFNGDGKTDVAVSATNDSNPGDSSARRGRVYVYFGRGAQFPGMVD